ncbi:MAG: ATP-binding cassette domain-containing protein [Acidimicrobiia bacterium]|nr:ATP-binding cassette domain-containing protein [Acidimicrobiia bacterium]
MVLQRPSGFSIDVDLTVGAGTTVALLGPNGAGKTTLIETLTGALPIDSGRIALGGRTLDSPTDDIFVPLEDRKVGVVFQDYLLFDHLDVLDNVAFGIAGRRRVAREAARSWIEVFDLEDFVDRRPRELSGGQAQRVALARTMATDPNLLLLDEPLAALDVESRSALRRTLQRHLVGFGGPRLLITHAPTDAFLLADRIDVLEHGRITQSGPPDEIRRRPATAYVAALAGTNLLIGANDRGTLSLRDHDLELTVADTHLAGEVLATIHPSAIALHAEQPHGSPRNSWRTTIAHVEPQGDVTRVTLGSPLDLSVDVTPAAVSSLGLGVGSEIWVAVKATEIEVSPA